MPPRCGTSRRGWRDPRVAVSRQKAGRTGFGAGGASSPLGLGPSSTGMCLPRMGVLTAAAHEGPRRSRSVVRPVPDGQRRDAPSTMVLPRPRTDGGSAMTARCDHRTCARVCGSRRTAAWDGPSPAARATTSSTRGRRPGSILRRFIGSRPAGPRRPADRPAGRPLAGPARQSVAAGRGRARRVARHASSASPGAWPPRTIATSSSG